MLLESLYSRLDSSIVFFFCDYELFPVNFTFELDVDYVYYLYLCITKMLKLAQLRQKTAYLGSE